MLAIFGLAEVLPWALPLVDGKKYRVIQYRVAASYTVVRPLFVSVLGTNQYVWR